MVGIFDPACELLPPWTKELYLCTVAPHTLYCTFSLTSSLLPPSQTKCTVYTECVSGWGRGGGDQLHCRQYILQIASPPQTK
jgi:hypothetical protein